MRWLLPENIEDILPQEAMRIELLRRRLLDLFFAGGFELVIPAEVPTTTPPTDWELHELRTRVDRDGQLRRTRVTVG